MGKPWAGFWDEILEAEKMMKKRSSAWLPRRVTRTPARRDLGRIDRWDRSNTPSLILTDGRADCLRFASPAEATGGLELGDLELGGLEEACKRLGRGLEYLVGMVLGAQIS